MSNMRALQKILQVRENEKKNAEQLHAQSVQNFEEIAMNMYNVLKKREKTNEAYDDNIQDVVSIEKMEQHTRYIEQLNHRLTYLQRQVNEARSVMEQKQVLVTEAHMEKKKIEKLIETRNKRYEAERKRQENAFMDELSMQQFLKRKQGESIV